MSIGAASRAADLERESFPTEGRRAESRLRCTPCLLGDFELNGSMGLLLHDDCSRGDAIAMDYVTNTKGNEITGSKLAVDREIEQSELANSPVKLQANANGPDVFESQRCPLSDELALVPRLAARVRCGVQHGSVLRLTCEPTSLSPGYRSLLASA